MKKQDAGKLIRKAIRSQQAKGVKIISNKWGIISGENGRLCLSEYSECCPLSALILEFRPKATFLRYDKCHWAGRILGKDMRWILSFFDGVDSAKDPIVNVNGRALQLGRRIRKEFRIRRWSWFSEKNPYSTVNTPSAQG